MKDLGKSSHIVLALTSTLFLLFALPANLSYSTVAQGSSSSQVAVQAASGLDCNGYSPISPNIRPFMVCADPIGNYEGRFYDNGHYIGHDEPSTQFFSSAANSGNNMEWRITLPKAGPVPTQNGKSVANFELFPTFWFSLALCDPHSYPQNPCIPDSDRNTGIGFATDAGGAFLELQLYPPGFPPFVTRLSCDFTHWCAAMNLFSLECNFGFKFCNSKCIEPANFAFLQTNGNPTGPPGPGKQTRATFTPNDKTFLMNPSDRLNIVIKDTQNGLLTMIDDLSAGQSGFMVASAANGFRHTDLRTCATQPFSFHPEYNTARPSNMAPWGLDISNVNFAMEIGHFELGAHGDHNDTDDPPCFPGPTVAGCLAFAQVGDLDFDGTPYIRDWPNGSPNFPSPVIIGAPNGMGVGPLSFVAGNGGAGAVAGRYSSPYPRLQFETDVTDSDSSCNPVTGAGCDLPPGNAVFYPFYTQAGAAGSNCVFNFGNVIPGVTTNAFGKDSQYGSPTVRGGPPDVDHITDVDHILASGPMANPCTP